MGNPQHYGIELPQRCFRLIDGLWNNASRIHGSDRADLGPLTSTFLLSMSIPIINLPVERIERQIGQGDNEGYADDRYISTSAVEAFEKTIQRGRFGDAPFFKKGAWRFIRGAPVNIAHGLSEDVAASLDAEEAAANAAAMPASQWISVLRNALAHGGIAYLDGHGRSSYGQPVKMFAFVSGKFEDGRCPNRPDSACRGERGHLITLSFLRITESDYRDFLKRWVSWLAETRLAEAAA